MDRTCQENKTPETAWAACNKDPKVWPGDEVNLPLDKASKTVTESSTSVVTKKNNSAWFE